MKELQSLEVRRRWYPVPPVLMVTTHLHQRV